MRRGLKLLLGLALSGVAAMPALAQSIYPVNRAEILVGAKFDLKVELAGTVAAQDIKVTINGRDAAAVFNRTPAIEANEDGLGHTAYWIRDVLLSTAGPYEVTAVAGNSSQTVHWDAFSTPERRARNVILFIGDGLSMAHRTAARVLAKGLVEGRYGGELAIDDMPHMALVSTSGTDSIVTDSANSMSAYATGHKSCVNAMGVYCAHNKNGLAHPKVETIAELAKRHNGGMAVGVVTNTEIEDATPAAMVAHVRRRSDYDDIVRMFYELRPEVMMGGGSGFFLPKSDKAGRRKDEDNYLQKFEALGYALPTTASDMKAAAGNGATRLLGLFHPSNLDGALDRHILKRATVGLYPDQPDLVDQTQVAIDVLSKYPNGFVLMVESGLIDKFSHVLDWERAVYDTIMLDNAVAAAKRFAAGRDDTLVIVVADHAHPVSIIGTYDDERPGERLRDKLGVYNEAKFPNYPKPDAEGYPPSVDVSRRLALVFAGFPDHCASGKPALGGPFKPTDEKDQKAVANESYCTPQATRMEGNLPFTQRQGVHAADDVVLTAMGPGSELFKGRVDNTYVFRVMATALGLGRPGSAREQAASSQSK
ncbi:MAG TPA: alkaline phosphatase [Hyphomicrobiaceae bacterium]|nr:alkaline phosphatase [Hyphomicrobiaceae bacterium]